MAQISSCLPSGTGCSSRSGFRDASRLPRGPMPPVGTSELCPQLPAPRCQWPPSAPGTAGGQILDHCGLLGGTGPPLSQPVSL